MNMDGFAEAVAEAKALMKSLGGEANVDIDAQLNKASVTAALTDITSITNSFNGANVKIGADVNDASLLAALAEIKAAVAGLGTAAGVDSAAGGAGRLLFGCAKREYPPLDHRRRRRNPRGDGSGLCRSRSCGSRGLAGRDERRPAHGVVYTATEATANMFHTTAGEAVGLGHALQSAQDAANPDVYSVLGSAVITVNEISGTWHRRVWKWFRCSRPSPLRSPSTSAQAAPWAARLTPSWRT